MHDGAELAGGDGAVPEEVHAELAGGGVGEQGGRGELHAGVDVGDDFALLGAADQAHGVEGEIAGRHSFGH